MTITSEADLERLKSIGRVCALARDAMAAALRPGMTTAELDEVGRKVLDAHGAQSAPIVTYDFPGTTCISVNEEIAHGIPGDRVIASPNRFWTAVERPSRKSCASLTNSA